MRYAKPFETPFRRAQWLLRTNGELKFHSLQRLGGLQHGVGVAFHPHLAPQLRELAVAAEQEGRPFDPHIGAARSEEHTSELQSLMRISYAVFCLKKKKKKIQERKINTRKVSI